VFDPQLAWPFAQPDSLGPQPRPQPPLLFKNLDQYLEVTAADTDPASRGIDWKPPYATEAPPDPDPHKYKRQKLQPPTVGTTAATPPGGGPPSGGGGPPGNDPPAGGEPPAGDGEPKRPKRPRATKQQVRERLGEIAQWLVQGVSTAQIIRHARVVWRIGRRMAQLYIQKVKQRWATAASREDYLAHLWLSKQQTERALAIAFNHLEAIDDPRKSAPLLRVIAGLIKQRDLTMASIKEHRHAVKRDQSPDSAPEQERRERIVSMPFEEFWERLYNLQRIWRHEWEQQHPTPQDLKVLRESYLRLRGWISGPPPFDVTEEGKVVPNPVWPPIEQKMAPAADLWGWGFTPDDPRRTAPPPP
jgi:hypothetical protein